MGNSHSHTYADYRRGVWMRKNPQLASGTNQRRRTRSLVDEYLPEFGHTPTGNQMQSSSPQKTSAEASHNKKEVREAAKYKPDARFMNAPMPPLMTHTPAQAEALKARERPRAVATSPLVPPEDRTLYRSSMPPSIQGDDNIHVHFQRSSAKGAHDHSCDRPRTPYPAR